MSEEYRKEHLAKEAERLLRDEVLREAIERMRIDALEALAVADPFDAKDILSKQLRVSVLDNILNELVGFVINGPQAQEDDDPDF